MASLASHPSFAAHLEQAAGIGVDAALLEDLSNRRYALGDFINEHGDKVRGIVPVEALSELGRTGGTHPSQPKPEPQGGKRIRRTATSKRLLARRDSLPLPKLRRLYPLLLLTSMSLVLFALVLSYALNKDETPFERFMDSESFGPPFLHGALSVPQIFSDVPWGANPC